MVLELSHDGGDDANLLSESSFDEGKNQLALARAFTRGLTVVKGGLRMGGRARGFSTHARGTTAERPTLCHSVPPLDKGSRPRRKQRQRGEDSTLNRMYALCILATRPSDVSLKTGTSEPETRLSSARTFPRKQGAVVQLEL